MSIDETWEGVSLDEFIACRHNLANNRQTRMLANLSLVGCYNQSFMDANKRNSLMLQSAKENLRDMAFFGLTEYQKETQYMFERTFHLKFRDDFVQYNSTHALTVDITPAQNQGILENTGLDRELYDYAKELFFERLKKMRSEDSSWTAEDDRQGGAVDYEEMEDNYEDEEDYDNQRLRHQRKVRSLLPNKHSRARH